MATTVLAIEGYDESHQLEKSMINPEKIGKLQTLWEDELSAKNITNQLYLTYYV